MYSMAKNGERCSPNKGGRGPSSFWLHDPDIVFRELNLKQGDSFLDLGCGSGDYSLEALKYVGKKGKVYSLDINERALNLLKQEAALREIDNLYPILGNATDSLPLDDGSVDYCLISTVLHCIDRTVIAERLMPELKRILKGDGVLSIQENHKKRSNFGPPEASRISPEELMDLVSPSGFTKKNIYNLSHTYILKLNVSASRL